MTQTFSLTSKQEEAQKLIAQGSKHFLIVGGSRCVSGDTILDGHTKTIAEQSKDGAPITVITSKGCQIAEAPFYKGRTKLLQIILENGSKVRVTTDHKFWNGERWVNASDLLVGDTVAVRSSSPFPQESTSDICPLELFSSDLRSCGKREDYQDYCFCCRRQYDQLLLEVVASFLSFCALQRDVLERIHDGRFVYWLGSDNQTHHLVLPESIYSLIYQMSPHLSSLGDFQEIDQSEQLLNPFFLQIYEWFLELLKSHQKYGRRFFLPRSFELQLRVFLDLYAHAMILTVRMNRAKGSHIAVRMHEMVRELIDPTSWTSKSWPGR